MVPTLVFLVASCAGPGAGKTAYVGGELFDGTGAPIIHDAVIIVADGYIEAIGPPDLVSVPRGADVVRLDGRWIVPGLIDAATHAERWSLPVFLSYGVTSARDVGGDQDSIIFLRTDVEQGAVPGPRLYISGAAIDGPPGGGTGATVVRTPADARRAVGSRVLIDATQIKVAPKITRRLLQPLMDEAQALETPVTAHLGKVDALTAARVGVRVIEQLSGIVEATVRNPSSYFAAHSDVDRGRNLVASSWRRLDSASINRTARALADAGVVIVPSLVAHDIYARLDDNDYQQSLDLTGVPEALREAWQPRAVRRAAGVSADVLAAARRGRPAQDRFVRLFRSEGGRIVAGSDGPRPLIAPGAALHRELELLVEAGLDPEAALLAATRDAARLLEADSIGVLLDGKVADFVILTADPLADISNTRKIMWIVARGVRYDPVELRTP